MNAKHWIVLTLAAFLPGACGSDKPDANEPKPMPTESKPMKDRNGGGVAEAAIGALAAELGVPESAIELDTIAEVDWPDASIGCPQPDMSYAQVITPGHKITLRVNSEMHVVHEANGRAFVCKTRKAQ